VTFGMTLMLDRDRIKVQNPLMIRYSCCRETDRVSRNTTQNPPSSSTGPGGWRFRVQMCVPCLGRSSNERTLCIPHVGKHDCLKLSFGSAPPKETSLASPYKEEVIHSSGRCLISTFSLLQNAQRYRLHQGQC